MQEKEKYSDFSTVEKQKNFLTAEEFPEGPYGSPRRADEPVQNKSTPWKKGQ
ncbi:cytosolic protein, partial [Parageobacillus toebii]